MIENNCYNDFNIYMRLEPCIIHIVNVGLFILDRFERQLVLWFLGLGVLFY